MDRTAAHRCKLVKQWTKQLISQEFKVDAYRIHDESKVRELGHDSLAVLELLAAIEARFDISIPNEEAVEISTFASLVNTISKHLNAKQQSQ